MLRLRIHTKLTAALAAPLVGLVAMTGYEVVRSAHQAAEIRSQVGLVKAATGPDGLLTGLQDERNRASIHLLGQDGLIDLPVADNPAARRVTDAALDDFRGFIGEQDEGIQVTYAPAFAGLDALDGLRSDIDADPGPYDLANVDTANDVFQRYTGLIDALLEANVRVAEAIDDPVLRRGAELSATASAETDLIAQLVRTFVVAAATDDLRLSSRTEVTQAAAQLRLVEGNHATIVEMATGPYAAVGATLEEQTAATGFLDDVAPAALRTGSVDITRVLGAVSIDRDESYYGFRTSVKRILERRADGLAADADRRVRLFRIFAALAVLIAAAATGVVARSITRPLRSLTRQATDMADRRLPGAVDAILDTPLGQDVVVPPVAPITVLTRDEVGDVAEVLNAVQHRALDLAVEQAVLRRNIADSFVNLGRRNQALLGRQLAFITELEHDETDPDKLADLFRLDHLATRMRRNAESLLVLAGTEVHGKRAAPVRIGDAIRAALGEVEDYQRVMLRSVQPTTIAGRAAADLAHLLAELIENALTFSPPDELVELRGRGRVDGYTLAIVDNGLGMSPDEVSRANRRLAGAESFTIAPSKYLGHYVAGHLAARHGIAVTLRRSAGHGITATVDLPPSVLAGDPEHLERSPNPVPSTPTLSFPEGSPAPREVLLSGNREVDPRWAPPIAPGRRPPAVLGPHRR